MLCVSQRTPIYQLLLVVQTIGQLGIAITFANTCIFSLGVSCALCAQFDILFCNLQNLEHTVALLRRGAAVGGNDDGVVQRLQRLQRQSLVRGGADDDADDPVAKFPFCVERPDDLRDFLPGNESRNATAAAAAAAGATTTTGQLYETVVHHQHLMYCADRLEAIHHPVCLVKFLVLTMQLCFLALNVLRVRARERERR